MKIIVNVFYRYYSAWILLKIVNYKKVSEFLLKHLIISFTVLSTNAVRISISSVQCYCRVLLYNTDNDLFNINEACLSD